MRVLIGKSFYLVDNQVIFEAIADMVAADRPVDVLSLAEELQARRVYGDIGGGAYLGKLLASVPDAKNGLEYAGRVRTLAAYRQMVAMGERLQRVGYDGVADPLAVLRDLRDCAAEAVRRLSSDADDGSGGAREISQLLDDIGAGKRRSIEFAGFPVLSRATQALKPASIAVVCGAPGDGKSFWILDQLMSWIEQGLRVRCLMLEETRDWHLHRALAICAKTWDALNEGWIEANAETVAAWAEKFGPMAEQVGMALRTTQHVEPTLEAIADWVDREAEKCDLLIIDPISMAQFTGRQRDVADAEFIRCVKRSIERSGSRLILVTHPPKVNDAKRMRPELKDIAGGAAYSRAASSVLYLERFPKAKDFEIYDASGLETSARVNRRITILKARNGGGTDKGVACHFGGDVCFREHGLILREQKGGSDDDET
jgi:KaiC/GvpD/RAD55 family RecA-like ATPase